MTNYMLSAIGLLLGVALISGGLRISLALIADYINGAIDEGALDKFAAVVLMLGSSFYVLYGSYCVMFK